SLRRSFRITLLGQLCFEMLFCVFLSRTAFIWPGPVTRPGLTECLYCLWPPRALILYQPADSMSLMISRTFILPSFTSRSAACRDSDLASGRPHHVLLPKECLGMSGWGRGPVLDKITLEMNCDPVLLP